MLMRPEYRSQIDVKYAKKIEAIVRKAPRGLKEQREDDVIGRLMLPCPVCETPLGAMDLTCHQCKTTLPICIATVSIEIYNQDQDFGANSIYINCRVNISPRTIWPLVPSVISPALRRLWSGKYIYI